LVGAGKKGTLLARVIVEPVRVPRAEQQDADDVLACTQSDGDSHTSRRKRTYLVDTLRPVGPGPFSQRSQFLICERQRPMKRRETADEKPIGWHIALD
jgi:hypothetical protein